MKIDIVLAGVGGQGILSIAASIGMAALRHDLFLKQAEVHGMSQRGGAVQSNLRIGSKKSSNMVVLGAATPFIDIPYGSFEHGIRNIFGRKGEEVVNVNLDALRKGREYSLNIRK